MSPEGLSFGNMFYILLRELLKTRIFKVVEAYIRFKVIEVWLGIRSPCWAVVGLRTPRVDLVGLHIPPCVPVRVHDRALIPW